MSSLLTDWHRVAPELRDFKPTTMARSRRTKRPDARRDPRTSEASQTSMPLMQPSMDIYNLGTADTVE